MLTQPGAPSVVRPSPTRSTRAATAPWGQQVAGNGSLVKGGFVKDRFLGWECAAEANVTHFFVDTTDYDLGGRGREGSGE